MHLKHLITLLLFITASLNAQSIKPDTVINMGVYKSYYNYALKQPLYVTYALYKGGGGCNRDDENFSFKKCGIKTAEDIDYAGNLLDKGHLANAEDFAYDCDKVEKTFCYFNCVPQTVKLNRGVWKTWEVKTRVLSQTIKLFVVAGSIYGNKTIGPNQIGVPAYCYKIVLNAITKKMIYCIIFPNNDSKTYKKITLATLKNKLNYQLVP